MSKVVNLKDYLEYTKLYYALVSKHKVIFGKDKHPHLPSLYTEGLIKIILGLEDLDKNEKHDKKGDSKFRIGNKTYFFEIKATGSDSGKTTINASTANFVLWGFFKHEQNNLDLVLKLINMNQVKLGTEINGRSNITLKNNKEKKFVLTIPLLGEKESSLADNIEKGKSKFNNFLKKHAQAK